MNQNQIRNFSIIAHIDHGKTTLTDRLLEQTHTIEVRDSRERMLDSNPIEQERGITIKLAPVTLRYKWHRGTVAQQVEYQLNLIDTPGHVDFNYEVERSLAACEGALLLVDATKGVQAQTLANLKLAQKQGLVVIPVINKVDAPLAQPEETAAELRILFPDQQDFPMISAKTGLNTEIILPLIIDKVPAPKGISTRPLRALVFNSFFHPFLGVIAFVRVIDGELSTNSSLVFMQTQRRLIPKQVGIFTPQLTQTQSLTTGQVGFVATGLKNLADLHVGDTLTDYAEDLSGIIPLPGYRAVRPNVYLEIYPTDASEYPTLLDAVGKLKLNDAALTTTNTSSPALGNGVRAGFLGLLHADVIRERLEREFNLNATFTSPSVEYLVTLTNGEELKISRATDFPDPSLIRRSQEPLCDVLVISPQKYLGAIIQTLTDCRGTYIDTQYLGASVEVSYQVPLVEVITNLHDTLKSVSSGYATFDYQPAGYRDAKLVKLTVLLNHEEIPPLSTLVVDERAQGLANKIAEHLKNTIPRHQFEIPAQVAIGGTIIARQTIKAFRKDVEAKLHGGDMSRNRKLLEKQKKGKARMKAFGSVNLPPEAFKITF